MELTNVGTSKKLFDKAKTADFAEIGKLGNGVNHHRIITGPAKNEVIWFPVVVEKEGKLVQSVRTINRPPEGTRLDAIVKLDEDLTRRAMREQGGFSEEEIKKYRSCLRPQTSYRFLVFNRTEDSDGIPKVRPYDYPWTVKDDIETLQNTKSTKHPGTLEYGLAFMYDLYINRVLDEKIKNIKYKTDYNVQVVQETTPLFRSQGQMRIPIAWLDYDPESGQPCPWNFADYFTEQELEAILAYDKDLAMLTKPDTAENIEEKLHKTPIFLQAKFLWGDKKGQPMFPILGQPDIVKQLLSGHSEILLLEPPEGFIEEEEKKETVKIEIPSSKSATPIILKDTLIKKVAAAEETTAVEVKPTAPLIKSIDVPAPKPVATSVPVTAGAAKPVVKKLWK